MNQYFRALGVPEPAPEFQFEPDRKWRFDYAWPDFKVALEVEGSTWAKGRHNHGAGMQKDMEKYNFGTMMGWRILRCIPGQLHDPATATMVQATIELVQQEKLKF